jgi:hypothetical protein
MERNHQRQESSSPDDQGTSRAEKEVNARMERLYAREMNVAQRDREMFQVPIETRMRMSIRQKRLWLDRVTPHVTEAERRFRERSARGQMDLLEMWDKQIERSAHCAPEATEIQAETMAEGNQSDGIDDDHSAPTDTQNDERQQSREGIDLENPEQMTALEDERRNEAKRDQHSNNQSEPPTLQHGGH